MDEQILRGSETVLLIDDEDLIIDVSKQMMEKIGYTVFVASSGTEALERYQDHRNEIDLVILDIRLPDMGGKEVYQKLKEFNSDIKVLLSSGYSIDGQVTEILNLGCDGFIQKPFNLKRLSLKIREVLDIENPHTVEDKLQMVS